MSDWLDAEDHANKALEYYERGRWGEAEAELRKALAIDADQPEWFFQLGMVLEASNRDAEALTAFEQASRLAPDQVEAVLGAALAHLRLGHLDQAESRLRTVLELDNQCEDAWARLIEVETRTGRHEDAQTTFNLAQYTLPSPSADCLMEVGASLMLDGALDRAAWCMEEAMRLDPTLPGAWQRLADLHMRKGDVPRAIELYTSALKDQPTDAATALAYAELLECNDRSTEAADVLRQVLDLDPANAEAHFRLGMMAMRRGQFQQAALALQLVRRLDRDHPWADRALAEALLHLGQLGDARRLLTSIWQRSSDHRAVDGEPEPPAALEALGHLCLEAGMAREAADVLAAALDDRDDPDRLLVLSRAHFQAGDLDKGRAVARRIVKRDPTCIAAIHNLALASLEEGRLGEAHGWVRRGMRANAQDDGLRSLRCRLWLARAGRVLRSIAGLR